MDKNRIVALKASFDGIVNAVPEANVEYWLARDLMPLLGYQRWENFCEAIQRAENSCKTQNIEISFHFRDVTKKRLGLNQTDLARRMRVSRPYLTKLMKADVNISFGTAMRLAKAVELDFFPELREPRRKCSREESRSRRRLHEENQSRRY